jgi:hypothetical protein
MSIATAHPTLLLQTKIVTPSVFFSTQATAHLLHKQLTQLEIAPGRGVWQWLMSTATANPTLLLQTLVVATLVFFSTQATVRLLHKQLTQLGIAPTRQV